MTRTEIMERLNKAEEAVTKKIGTLERHQKKLEKLNGIIAQSGYTVAEIKTWKWSGDEFKNNLIWKMIDVENCLEDIKNTEKAIEDKKRIVENWKAKLEEATKEEKVIDNELPAVISDFMEKLVEQWNEWDKKSRARLKKEYDWLGYREFIKKWKYSGYEKMRETDEQIEKENRRNAKAICLNLWRRVKETVGEVTDCHGLEVVSGNEFEGCVINGMVYGTDGACVVESVSAGGYNIQKWHIRTLVKRWKK